jgi:hypothetical protein
MAKDKSVDVLNSLITINNDRIAGYETALDEAKDEDLRTLFTQYMQNSKTCKNEEAIISEGSENVEVAEALCSLKNGDAPASCDNDACSLKHFDMVTDPSDHYYIGASGQVLLLPYI